MIIKKKMFRTNFIMVIVPLLVLIVFNSIFLEIMLEKILFTYGITAADEKNIRNLYIIYEIFEYSVIIVAFLVSNFFTKKNIKTMMIPIQNLCDAAARIQENNLDEDVPYEQSNELEAVCVSFNQMQYQLKENIEKNRIYEQDRNEMLAGISHDLRTPLTSIKSYVKGLKDGVAKTPEKEQEYLEVIYKKSCEMESLIEQLFLFSKLETDNLPFSFNPVSIEKYMVTLLDSLEYDLQNRGAVISLSSDCMEQIVSIDGEQMARVIANIMNNSIKYNQGKELCINVLLQQKGDYVAIQIKDNGTGVPDEKLSRLFDSFYRVDEARSNSADGSGLGLSIAKKIIEAHNGNITAKNEDGFVITIELPIERENEL